jgi:sporulation protein YlmC with PRC-barrel domain
MTQSTQFTIGVDAVCTDGPCGEVIRVVVNPVAREVTHLVVEPKHRQGFGRLVPLDLVVASAGQVKLTCTLEEFNKLELAEETHFLPGEALYPGYAASQVFAMPYYGLGMGTIAPPLITDAVPLGEVAVRRGEHVHATDGEIGQVQGLVIEPDNHHVTHVLLQQGHIWGRKQVAIPIGAVADIKNGIRLNMTKQEVQALPPIGVDDPIGA